MQKSLNMLDTGKIHLKVWFVRFAHIFFLFPYRFFVYASVGCADQEGSSNETQSRISRTKISHWNVHFLVGVCRIISNWKRLNGMSCTYIYSPWWQDLREACHEPFHAPKIAAFEETTLHIFYIRTALCRHALDYARIHQLLMIHDFLRKIRKILDVSCDECTKTFSCCTFKIK